MKKAYRFSIGGICFFTILLAFIVSLGGQSSMSRFVVTGFSNGDGKGLSNFIRNGQAVTEQEMASSIHKDTEESRERGSASPSPRNREQPPRLPKEEPTKTTAREAEKGQALTLVVNKKHHLTAEYVPPDLTVPQVPFSFTEDLPKKRMRKEAAEALEELFNAAYREGIELVGVSAYRSYERQAEIFAYNARQRGEEIANQVSARPGESEHQTGLAVDVSCAAVKYQLVEDFGETKEGKWLADHAAEYGFIIRYPKGKEEITGYQYEPWHLRYVGREAALKIKEQGLTLEEYMGVE